MVADAADAQHAVEAFAHEVDAAVGAAELDFELRVMLQKFRQARNDDVARHGQWQVHAQAAAQAALAATGKQRVELLEIGDQILAAFVVGEAVLRHLHLARGAVEEAGAQRVLQLLNRIGDGGLEHAQALCRGREAAKFGHPAVDAHGVDLVHFCPYCPKYLDRITKY